MKNIFFLFFLISSLVQAQQVEQYMQLVTNESGQYRFQTVEVRSYETFNDTLIVDFFPDRWLDSFGLESYQHQIIGIHSERMNELRRLFQIEKAKIDYHVQVYDQIHGEGSFLAWQKAKILESLQGEWRLIDRNGTNTVFDITITGTDFRRNATRFGTISITDDLQIFLSGFYPFDLTLSATNNGAWRGARTNRVFILRK